MGGSDPARFRSFSARFASVVYPGDGLETKMWKVAEKNGFDDIIFQTIVKNNGRIVL